MPAYGGAVAGTAMTNAGSARLADELPPPLRLAVAYAPQRARGPWTALLVLDRRLARAALSASEPMLGQIRLAWWRERFRSPASAWPEGEPLLAALASFEGERGALEALVDAWEKLIGGAPDSTDVAELGEARAAAVLALARSLGCAARLDDAVAAMARFWALSDLARALGSDAARDLARAAETRAARLPRSLRPLAILMDLVRWPEADPSGGPGLRALLRIVRLGLWGR
ncbi:MAG: squalene/phytoene synthase family protein [Novosphingobium sp.]|nr:squalene/phytoene synthase family protein [Novosphingobium sp.]